MSGFDSNPFEETIDVNPFQVRNARATGEAVKADVLGSFAGFVVMMMGVLGRMGSVRPLTCHSRWCGLLVC